MSAPLNRSDATALTALRVPAERRKGREKDLAQIADCWEEGVEEEIRDGR